MCACVCEKLMKYFYYMITQKCTHPHTNMINMTIVSLIVKLQTICIPNDRYLCVRLLPFHRVKPSLFCSSVSASHTLCSLLTVYDKYYPVD